MNKKRVLFIKLSALGDVVMALPACRFLVGEGAEVTWVVGKAAKPLVDNFSGAAQILAVNETDLLAGNVFEKSLQVLNINWKLRKYESEAVIVGHADKRYRYLVSLPKWVRNNLVPIQSFNFPREMHHSVAYMKMAFQALGKRASDSAIADQVKNYWPEPLLPWQGQGSRLVAIAPGGAKNILADDSHRRWPLENYRLLVESLIQKGYEVHLLGALSDQWVRPSFKGLPIRDRIGELGLLDLIKEFSIYRALITHDSGPLHLAGLARVPVYGLFGPTLPDWRFPVVNPGKGLVTKEKLSCQPCYDGKQYPPCEHKNCLKNLKPEQVLSFF